MRPGRTPICGERSPRDGGRQQNSRQCMAERREPEFLEEHIGEMAETRVLPGQQARAVSEEPKIGARQPADARVGPPSGDATTSKVRCSRPQARCRPLYVNTMWEWLPVTATPQPWACASRSPASCPHQQEVHHPAVAVDHQRRVRLTPHGDIWSRVHPPLEHGPRIAGHLPGAVAENAAKVGGHHEGYPHEVGVGAGVPIVVKRSTTRRSDAGGTQIPCAGGVLS